MYFETVYWLTKRKGNVGFCFSTSKEIIKSFIEGLINLPMYPVINLNKQLALQYHQFVGPMYLNILLKQISSIIIWIR